MEADTPGQILGVTYKDDGKSSSFSSNSSSSPHEEPLFTQGPKKSEFDNYESHDVKDSKEFTKHRLDSRFYFGLGMLIVFVGFLFYGIDYQQSYLDEQTELALKKRREREAKKNPFDEA